MKIVVFTADEANGGIKQFVSTITRTTIELGYDTVVFFPENRGVEVDEDIVSKVRWYPKEKSLNPYNRCAKSVAKLIGIEKPDLVIMPESSIFTLQVLMLLPVYLKTALFIHDVTPHPSNMGVKRKLTYFLSRITAKRGFKIATNIVVLSKNSYRLFIERYNNFKDKVILYTLGGHIPFTNGRIMCPNELESKIEDNYALFFGRIDKYKGVERLVRVYKTIEGRGEKIIPLVIAGRGVLDNVTEDMIQHSQNLLYLNRFIKDEEMIWLFEHCKFVVLPYSQASQSGVLPISYAFGKPVAASNIEGLKEFVDVGETGFLFDNDDELGKVLVKLSNEDLSIISDKCKIYSKKEFDWRKNTQELIHTIIGC